MPVAFEVATTLRAPLDVFVVRKLGLPGHEELAMGAIATGGVRALDDGLATGATMRAAVEALREEGAARVVVAVRSATGAPTS